MNMPEYSTEDKVDFLQSVGYTITYSEDFVCKGGKGRHGTYEGTVVIRSPWLPLTEKEVNAINYDFDVDQVFRKLAVIAYSNFLRENLRAAQSLAVAQKVKKWKTEE